jgi:hypothetical protein
VPFFLGKNGVDIYVSLCTYRQTALITRGLAIIVAIVMAAKEFVCLGIDSDEFTVAPGS